MTEPESLAAEIEQWSANLEAVRRLESPEQRRDAYASCLTAASVFLPRVAALLRTTERRDQWHAICKGICDEWSEANGATCDPDCSSYGHTETCKATNIAEYLKSLRAEMHRLARGHDEYNRVNRILTNENDELRATIDAAEARQYKADLDAELHGNGELRREFGARAHETMHAWIARLHADSRGLDLLEQHDIEIIGAPVYKHNGRWFSRHPDDEALDQAHTTLRAALSAVLSPAV